MLLHPKIVFNQIALDLLEPGEVTWLVVNRPLLLVQIVAFQGKDIILHLRAINVIYISAPVVTNLV